MAGKAHNISAAFRFWVEIDGLLVGGFSEVSGLSSETELEEYREGGLNGYVHHFPKGTKFSPIVLKRGITTASDLWDWYAAVTAGTITRKHGSVIMQNVAGLEMCRWNFFHAYPSKWNGPELSSMSNSVAIESIELVHNGLKAIFKK